MLFPVYYLPLVAYLQDQTESGKKRAALFRGSCLFAIYAGIGEILLVSPQELIINQ